MARDLGGFTTVADRKEARRVALVTGGVVFGIGGGATLRLGRFDLFLASIALGVAAFFVHRAIAMRRMRKGTLDVVDDDELGVVLTLKRDGPGVRVPLSRAQIVGRTRTLATVGAVRFQIAVTWEGGAFVANLAIPFRADAGDVEGVLPAQYDLDRTASRALDALSYEVLELQGGAPKPIAVTPPVS